MFLALLIIGIIIIFVLLVVLIVRSRMKDMDDDY